MNGIVLHNIPKLVSSLRNMRLRIVHDFTWFVIVHLFLMIHFFIVCAYHNLFIIVGVRAIVWFFSVILVLELVICCGYA